MFALAAAQAPQLDRALLTGFLAMVVWLVCFKEQRTSKAFVIGLAISSAVLTVFAFMQTGAWPLGFVQAAMTVSALGRCWKRETAIRKSSVTHWKNACNAESRTQRLFGSVGSDN